MMKKKKHCYHHGNLAESLLDAVGNIASQFGLEAVTLRACAKRAGVSPSSAFRHYADKRALMTVFATRALRQLSQAMYDAGKQAQEQGENTFFVAGLAYITFALDKPAFFRAMWREEAIYIDDEDYVAAADQLRKHLPDSFAETIPDQDTGKFSPYELLAWSAVHGLASLFVEGAVGRGASREQKLQMAQAMLDVMEPAFAARA